MAYTINLTSGAIFAQVNDGEANNTSNALTLIGRNFTGYGELTAENFVHLLENSADDTFTGSALTGQLWFDSGTGVLKVYSGAEFKSVSGAEASVTEPVAPVAGDLWLDGNTEQLKVYKGTLGVDGAFILAGPLSPQGHGQSGPEVVTITDTVTIDHVVVKHWVNDELVGITSKDAEFTPAVAIAGFSTIKPGYQLSTLLGSGIPKFEGTSTNSVLFDGIDTDGFLSATANDSTTGSLGVLNDSGITFGVNSTAQLLIEGGTDAVLRNVESNGDLILRVNDGGVPTDVITIDGATARARVDTPAATTDIANMSYVDTKDTALQAYLEDFVVNQVLGNLFAVGSYFTGPDPNGTIPGTWTQLGANRFLMSSPSGNGITGGTNSTTLAIANMPAHNHGGGSHRHLYIEAYDSGATTGANDNNSRFTSFRNTLTSFNTPTVISTQGSGVAFENRPLYETVEIWKRIA